ncbi:protein let-756 [Cylas formicarius]|uniref:protein let-756 n=1 Tax=Cylas formicarius TaxID=197179 RepID=UPI002958A6B8|nr:protein let-756 [Cylas formicarius]
MVKALFLGLLLVATTCGFVNAAPKGLALPEPPVAPSVEDPAARSERSTNLSHVTGTARKIQMFIKNRHLQILPGGTVNGTTDDTSPYTILQRTTVGIGQMKIQGVATCQYLCMDECGLLYGSVEFGDECIFNETIEETNYNKYSSSKYSNERRTFYLALNRRGQPRKVVIKARQQLGKLSSYARVLTRTVSSEHPMRHHGHQCPSPGALHHSQTPNDPPRCRKRKKKKKKKRKNQTDEFEMRSDVSHNNGTASKTVLSRVKCDSVDAKDNDECQRDLTTKKNTKFNSEKSLVNNPKKKKKKIRKGVRKRLEQVDQSQESTTTTTAMPASTTTSDDVINDEDYGMETSTHLDWEETTGLSDVSMAVEKNAAENNHSTNNSD